MKDLVIFGTGKMAELLCTSFYDDFARKVAGFVVDSEYRHSDVFCGKQLVSFDSLIDVFPPESHDILVAVGYAECNKARERAVTSCTQLGYSLASYVSPHAIVPPGFVAEENVVIFEGAAIQRYVTLSKGCIVWTNACVCHHTVVEPYVFIGPGATVCGGTRLRCRSLVGAGAIIRDFLSVGEGAIVGAGSTLLRDLPDGALCNAGESPVIYEKAEQLSIWPPKTERK